MECPRAVFKAHYFLAYMSMIFQVSQNIAAFNPMSIKLNFNLKDHFDAKFKLNEDLCRISNWTFRNKILINPDKTKLVIFGSRAITSKVENFHLTLLGKEFRPAASAKDLGVLLDSNLTL